MTGMNMSRHDLIFEYFKELIVNFSEIEIYMTSDAEVPSEKRILNVYF